MPLKEEQIKLAAKLYKCRDTAKTFFGTQYKEKLMPYTGQPVTMLKDQSKDGKLIFLKPHPSYPTYKDISMMKGRAPKPLMECNGFCGTNDLLKNPTESQINYQ